MEFMIAAAALKLQLISRQRVLRQLIFYVRNEKVSRATVISMPGSVPWMMSYLQVQLDMMELECGEIEAQLRIIEAGRELLPHPKPKHSG